MAPAHTSYHGELAQLRKFSAENENDLRCAREMESILERDREADANATLHFALGKIYTDLKQYDASFQHYLDANRLTRKTFEYSPDQTTEFVDRTIKAYPPTLFDRLESLAAASDLPVFILGMPRSGTTLTEQIISSHPDVAGAGELGDIGRMAEALSKFLGSDLHYPECIAQLNPSTVSAYVDRYIQELRSISSNALRITDKMPGNFKYAGLIALLFKNIRIVHTARNPIDTCISIFFQNFKGFHPYAYDLYELGLYYREYHRLMEHWKTVLPVKIHESRYEDLIADPEYYSRQLIDYVGLPWDDQCLRFHETKRVVQTASHWQVRQPIYKSSSQRWKRYDKFLGPLKEGLGDLARED
jgi:tetratricopeptide (TPR) repeat protein